MTISAIEMSDNLVQIDIKNHSIVLDKFYKELSTIGPFKHNLSKSSE